MLIVPWPRVLALLIALGMSTDVHAGGSWVMAGHAHAFDAIEVNVTVLWIERNVQARAPCVHPIWRWQPVEASARTATAAGAALGSISLLGSESASAGTSSDGGGAPALRQPVVIGHRHPADRMRVEVTVLGIRQTVEQSIPCRHPVWGPATGE